MLCLAVRVHTLNLLLRKELASGAPLTLIDDPIAGLDKPSVTYLAQALNSCADQPERAVVVAHYAPLPGVRWAHRVDLAGLGR